MKRFTPYLCLALPIGINLFNLLYFPYLLLQIFSIIFLIILGILLLSLLIIDCVTIK